MVSCDFASDFIISAILSAKFDSAKKLCEIFFFENKQHFSFLYALANLALQNNDGLTKNILSSVSFSEGFRQQTHLANDLGFHLPFHNFDLTLDQEKFVHKLKTELFENNSQLRKFLTRNYNQKLFLAFTICR